MNRIPRLLIAGTESGVGKTTLAVGLMAACVDAGMVVQPFKVGPDYLDPTYHTRVTGRASRNLDTWLLRPRQVQGVFQEACRGAELAIIEGVMGLFDGHGAHDERGSTAELAKLLRVPVVLVVDASRMARSVAALVRGYATFDRGVRVAGVLCNRVSPRHAALLQDAIRRATGLPFLGFLPQEAAIALPERHLGLVPAQEAGAVDRVRARLVEEIRRSVDVGALRRLAQAAPPLPAVPPPWPARGPRTAPVRIGLAQDEAFHFYYHENLELLRAYGAELVPFSPLMDPELPADLQALYLGGGFPEVFAAGLERNASMRRALRTAVGRGVPTYAECGGLMYLAQRLVDQGGRARAMVGVLPGTVRMTPGLQHFGYASVRARRNTILTNAGARIRGHEFHYSVWDRRVSTAEAAYTVSRPREPVRLEGFARGNVLASYLHLHFLTNPRWGHGLVQAARRFQRRGRPVPRGGTGGRRQGGGE